MTFSERLKELRHSFGMTQKELAKKCQVAQSCIAMLEKGRSEANISTIIALSNVFDVSIEYLVGIEDDFGISTAKKNAPQLNVEEQQLLNDYRALSAPGKQLIKTTLKTLLPSSEAAQRKNKKLQ